eukprot:scaffold113442_cov14-Tisochrysis_lutea.AAC.1
MVSTAVIRSRWAPGVESFDRLGAPRGVAFKSIRAVQKVQGLYARSKYWSPFHELEPGLSDGVAELEFEKKKRQSCQQVQARLYAESSLLHSCTLHSDCPAFVYKGIEGLGWLWASSNTEVSAKSAYQEWAKML